VARTRRPEAKPAAEKPARARLFVALELPDDARAALVEWQERALAGRDDLRAVQPDALHVTLAFLGHRPAEEIDAIADAVAGAVGGLRAVPLRPKAVLGVPRRRPRLFAIDLEDPDGRAGAIHAAVSEALSAGGFYEPERRRFWPHITVARVGRSERQAAPITIPPPADEFTATEVVLYRSHLGRGPARYEALARFTL
jgi:RNA 2',3'-cyclic 3'-phosphodiesterase